MQNNLCRTQSLLCKTKLRPYYLKKNRDKILIKLFGLYLCSFWPNTIWHRPACGLLVRIVSEDQINFSLHTCQRACVCLGWISAFPHFHCFCWSRKSEWLSLKPFPILPISPDPLDALKMWRIPQVLVVLWKPFSPSYLMIGETQAHVTPQVGAVGADLSAWRGPRTSRQPSLRLSRYCVLTKEHHGEAICKERELIKQSAHSPVTWYARVFFPLFLQH